MSINTKTESLKRLSLKPINTSATSKYEILEYFQNTWNLYETLFSSIKDDDSYYLIPDPLRRPLLFYYGHAAVFYINKLLLGKTLSERINPHFESLFETGVDEMSWDDMNNDQIDWPTVMEVRAYRKQVYEKICETIKSIHFDLPIDDKSPIWALLMCVEHDRIHLETSSVLIRQLPVNLVERPPEWKYAPKNPTLIQNELIQVPSGSVSLGKPKDFPSYGWDNEYGHKQVHVPAFQASKFLITNGEFLRFVQDNAYNKKEYWTNEGWQWKEYNKAQHPRFWIPDATDINKKRKGSIYLYRATFDLIEMPLSWPVDVNYYEAKAYCKWKGSAYRVITEAEWHRIRSHDSESPKPLNDIIFKDDPNSNLNLCYASASPVDLFEPSEAGFYDVHGNVWEWTEDHFDGFPGFKTHPLYQDFSIPCFDEKHNIIMGGSWISTGDEASVYARYAFRRHFFQNLGFRIVKAMNSKSSDVYETSNMLSEYLLMHYGKAEDILPYKNAPHDALHFPERCVEACIRASSRKSFDRALDIGCAVGRASLEMTRYSNEVIGLDFSQSFIDAAKQVQKGDLTFAAKTEGLLTKEYRTFVPNDIDRNAVSFQVADACNLPKELGSFDLVLVANLLCRLRNPRKFLEGLSQLVRPDGIVLITTPCSWFDTFTPQEQWLGGRIEDGVEQNTLENLNHILKSDFDLLESSDIPFIIREHIRKYQWVTAQASVWRRNGN
ncbi:MAG: 5-histidylcysteine sulfoxide synthase/putative 4-mercaptohistidine N1-methyltransferase [Chlamydiales bacterium]|jgi:5-histidylcysteine sulfoxide synthase/putative 4-mercaptohistidine N1-methyltranferase